MGLMAARAATRMSTRSQYRTMSRMYRRRSYIMGGSGMSQDFSRDEQPAQEQNGYSSELEQLASLKSQGLITQEEYDAKKKQILGI